MRKMKGARSNVLERNLYKVQKNTNTFLPNLMDRRIQIEQYVFVYDHYSLCTVVEQSG